MSKEHAANGESFASPDDIIKAHQIAEEELGPEFCVNFLGLPKNVGVQGDERHYGHSPVISSVRLELLRPLFDEALRQEEKRQESIARKEAPAPGEEALQRVMSRITGETTATRVLIDITPDDCTFIIEH